MHLLCKEPPGPFTLTIRLGPTGATALPKAYALKARLVKALDLAAAPRVGDSAALASSMAKGKRIGIITPRGDAPATTPRVKKADLTSGPPALSPPQPKAELWTSSGLHPGDQVEQYVLRRQMDRDEQISNIETWLATDGAMGDLILKIYWGLVGDEYGGRTDLGPYISSLLPELDKLVAMPRKSGVAPWVRYHYREQDRRLVMCRRAYPDRMLDRFPISGAPYPGPALLEVLGQIAEGIDHLTDLAPLLGPPLTFSISTDNLLMEGALACIADFAPVLGTIRGWMFETYGPVLMLRRASSFCLPELYYFLRTGMKTRKDAVGAKCVDGLIDGAERDLVARALSSNPPEYSCKEFVKQLALASHPSKSGLDGTFSRQPPIELRRPPPLPPWSAPHDYTYDTNLSVPGGIEPRMESILQRDIPEFRWQDEAENWGKIRLVGNSLEPFEGVTVSIARNEPPGPFNLRITVQGAIRPAADAFHKAITQRIELALYAAAEGPPKVQPSFTKSEKPFHPPFFSRRSILCVSREPGMALRIKDAIPELIWLDEAPDWEQLRIIATRDHPRTVVSILRGDPTGPFLDLWVHTAATSTTIAHDMRSKEVLNSLLDRIYAATQAYRPTVTFNNELSIHEKRLPWLPSILEKGIPELSWRNDPKKSDPADTLRIVGTSPDPDQSLFVCITPAQPLSSPYTRLRIEIVLRRCFEHHAEPFHRALLQRLNHSFRPNSYHPLESMAPEALQTGIVEFFVSLISTPFVRPFFSLRAEVPVAEEFENDGASAIVPRLRDNIPELVWTSAAEDKGKIRIAAQSDRQADSPAAVLPTANRIQYTRLSLFRPGPSTPFELWIHITADSSDEANRALHSLEHRLCRVLGSAGDPDLNRNDQGPGPPL